MAAPAAHLHTVTLRSQATAKSAHVAQGAAAAASQLRQEASAASLDPEDVSSPSSSSSDSESASSFGEGCSTPASSVASPLSRSSQPIYGVQIDYEAYPAHPELGAAVRMITAKQYAELADQAGAVLDTPEHVLFPWLHGADMPHTQQAAYFGFQSGARCPTPRFRGLVTLTADQDRPAPFMPQNRMTSLGSTSFVSSTSIASSLVSDSSSESGSSADTSILDVVPPPMLVSTLQPDDILERGSARFAKPQLPPNVNLRNFRIQAPKYATIADVAIYSERGAGSNEAVMLAQRVARAQQAALVERRARGEDCLDYCVLLVTDPFSVFERDHPHLVSIDTNGCSRNRVDFFEREREEMRALTEASEIGTNIFLGNSADLPNAAAEGEMQNPLGFSICVEAHDQALMSHLDALRAYEGHIARIPSYTDERNGVTKPRKPLDVVHLETISTGQACPSHLALAAYIENTINLVLFLRRQAMPAPTPVKTKRRSSNAPLPPPSGGRRVLIHCQDGYTDSSVLALAYVMYDRSCSLPEAYLHLQLTAGRSFFVYPADRDVLERIEQRFERMRREMLPSPELESPPLPDKSMRRFFSSARSQSPVTPRATPATLSLFDKAAQFPWFYDERFDGHFPSRILPFLYLGNLNHAMNALMLKQLGITHVVSIGETALVVPKVPENGSSNRMPTNSLWLEQRMGNISVLDLRGVSDDGIDSIRPSIDVSNAFIEEARRAGGKVLVHCRVGVSRSATLTIAYLMRHLEMDLASAYLLCRSRRLNILIQPTLLFMNALQWYEARLNAERQEKGEPMVLGHLAWPHFAHEVFQLNSRYLSC